MKIKWSDENITHFIESVGREDKFVKSYRKSKSYQKNVLIVTLKCKNNTYRDIEFNQYRKGYGSCKCKSCTKDNNTNKSWKSYFDYYDFFIEFGLEPTETPESTNKSVFCITKDKYLVLASVDNLKRAKNKNAVNFDKFGIRNKYNLSNLKNFCFLERPDYQVLPNQEIIGVKAPIWFKYVGNNLKPNTCRYFKTTVDCFVNGFVGHPLLTMSKGEMRVKDYLDLHKINYKMQYTDSRCRDKRILKFDFALFDKNNHLLGIVEFDGSQHDKDTNWWGKSLLNEIQKRDNIKNNFCAENKIPLLRIKQNRIGTTEKQLKAFINEYQEKKNETRKD